LFPQDYCHSRLHLSSEILNIRNTQWFVAGSVSAKFLKRCVF
jgi:hypothetical protein